MSYHHSKHQSLIPWIACITEITELAKIKDKLETQWLPEISVLVGLHLVQVGMSACKLGSGSRRSMAGHRHDCRDEHPCRVSEAGTDDSSMC